jgi:hypothetical protein
MQKHSATHWINANEATILPNKFDIPKRWIESLNRERPMNATKEGQPLSQPENTTSIHLEKITNLNRPLINTAASARCPPLA